MSACCFCSESVHTTARPVKLHAEDGKVTFRKDERQRSPTRPQSSSPRLPSPASPAPSPPPAQRSGGSSAPIPVPSLSRASSLSQQLQRDTANSRTGSPGHVKKRSASSSSTDRVCMFGHGLMWVFCFHSVVKQFVLESVVEVT